MKKLLLLPFLLLAMSSFGTANFTDVADENAFNQAIEKLTTQGVITGYDDGTYKPGNRINRAEFLTLLMRSTGENFSGEYCFPDVKNEWFAPAVCEAKRTGIIEGYDDGKFYPAQNINLAEASKIITKVLELPEGQRRQKWYEGYLKALENKKALPVSLASPEENLRRGEMAEIIWRIKDEVTDKPSLDTEKLTNDLPTFGSCAVMDEKLSEKYMYPMPAPYLMRGNMMAEPAMMEMSTDSASSTRSGGAMTKSDGNFSETNVQVKGVDEADIIKTDGEYIYIASEGVVRIIKALPADRMTEVATIDFSAEIVPAELLLNKDQLIVISRRSPAYHRPVPLEGRATEMMIWPPTPWQQSATVIHLYDVSNSSDPKLTKKMTVEGNFQTVRRIDNQLYLVSVSNFHGLAKSENKFPRIFMDDETTGKVLTDCVTARYIPGHYLNQVLTLTAWDLDNPEKNPEQEVVYGGTSSTVYVSGKNAYITSPAFDNRFYTDWRSDRDWHREKTNIFRFNLRNGKVKFEKRGVVDGHLLNQFSLDENDGFLRVATTEGWGDNSKNAVTVFDIADMQSVGSITDIAPGEKIYSARFIGDRLYMVTFKTIDPLFVIDLRNPKDPRILGKLKIPGFSNYLHPYDDQHLIGFGKSTEESKDGTFAWQQGMKIALFDVSDVKNPRELHQISIGDRGTESELLHNHRALMWDPSRKLIGFPIRIATIKEKPRAEEERWAYGETTFTGGIVYQISLKNGFEERVRVTHYDEQDLLKAGDYMPYNYRLNIARLLYIGDNLFSFSPSALSAENLHSGVRKSLVKFEN